MSEQDKPTQDKLIRSEEEWRKRLTPEQYRVAREAGTERPFSGDHEVSPTPGTYHCIACDAKLFDNDTKFDAGCGWPSFDRPYADAAVEEHFDTSHGMRRVEVRCRRCESHLGHVFPDGPTETGQRYCINSVSLRFKPVRS
ncbi:peptide-methionine (R)-S-oxide reductase MsrB [Cobetia marina]|jgi:peptide-methionine (R)-S-oxide reductase|uniref:peptide-methionine (R)-S-oxide reductase MsrB n=1 Tax=Cobetia TaxID=204286 RepID=UPI000984B60A|nr:MULTISPECIES: peptide-methionine (R)-S-oxide reductase MsrB [Cobetia]MDA5564700.1 peptide-methionine (R)-S-oxide reductase MsrB [Cobetia sp. MMG027]MDN2657615.1 peptide-methionine (R)-S-oxide reductase MsrB [Cobetia sp. 14N.309.X.WAT.E.A4]MDO6788872.1 peptide-methionine (R)-S-oxide reductase MsrB [Cobetia marina]POR05582.1 peptide-methionine (R)-S-oxide reductase [Cobetia sp. MM1IDA2H-1]